jgi:hypothetical protein
MREDDHRNLWTRAITNQVKQDIEAGLRHIEVQDHTINPLGSAKSETSLPARGVQYRIVVRGMVLESSTPKHQVFDVIVDKQNRCKSGR